MENIQFIILQVFCLINNILLVFDNYYYFNILWVI